MKREKQIKVIILYKFCKIIKIVSIFNKNKNKKKI